MLVDGWEELFPARILARGYDYFLDGRVGELAPEDAGWRATIAGMREYDVFVTENVVDSTCDCPYFPEGGLCKHIAATCYEIEDHKDMAREIAIEAFFRHGKREPSAEDLVKGLGHEEQLAFLLEIVRTDDHWAKKAIRTFGDLEERRLETEFVAGVNEVVREHAYRGFIDYRHALACENELYAYVTDFLDPLMRRGAHVLVLRLTFAFERSLARIEIDDSDGFFESMVSLLNDYWAALLQVDNAAIDEELFEWLRDLAPPGGSDDLEGDISWYLQENAPKVLQERFASRGRFAKQVEELAASALKAEEVESDFKRFSTNFEKSQWMLLLLRSLVARHAPLAELEAVVEGRAPSADATRLLVEYARSLGDDEAAIRILRACIDQPAGYRYPTEFELELIKLLNKTGRADETADIYLDLIAHGTIANQDQLRSWVRKARNRFGDAWPEAKRKLIATLDGSPNRLASFLAAEGDYREMMDVLGERGTLEDLNDHRGELANRYPEEFLSRYEQLVRKEVFGPASGRSVYRGYARILERMQSLPGGHAAVAGIVRDLCEAYPRRTALKEELRRLG